MLREGVRLWLVLFFVIRASTFQIIDGSFTNQHLSHLKNETRKLIDHGWGAYMSHAFPADELRPISCAKYERVDDIYDIQRNDVLGNYSVTFIDTLTTFAVIEDVDRFKEYIEMVRAIDFRVDSVVQVFETTIRALGSLLSAHLYASDHFKFEDYDGFLLEKATELGDSLLVAYDTSTNLPLARINLQKGSKGLPKSIVEETCTAGAATPMLELTLLSILTNNTRYENASRSTFMRLWNSRSELDLLPMSLDPLQGNWRDAVTGIGASIDSFYEYALKGAILFDDDELEDVWVSSYKALSTHSRLEWFFTTVNVESGFYTSHWIDALGAFFSGVLVLAGKVTDAITAHQPYLKLWNTYGGIPERWDFLSQNGGSFSTGSEDPISLEWYPLRPEFIESTYYLYQATKDPLYLRVGEKVLEAFKANFKVECGFAGYRDIRTGEMQDRMESFVLSETLMYLYLLFDETNKLNRNDRMIFSTEGHPLWIPKGILSAYKEFRSKGVDTSAPTTAEGTLETKIDTFTIGQLMEILKSWKGDFNGYVERSSNNLTTLNHLPEILERLSSVEEDFGTQYIFHDSCEVIETSFFYSNQLNDPQMFTLNSKFKDQWRLRTNDIEIQPSFYSIFANGQAKCDREPTVTLMDYTLGDKSKIRENFLSTFSNPLTKKFDLWVNEPDGLRIRLELLEIDKIDFNNSLIDESKVILSRDAIEYDVYGTCKPKDQKKTLSVFRLRVINEVRVEDRTVYLADGEALREMERKKKIGVTKNGNLMLDGIVVDNLRVWKD